MAQQKDLASALWTACLSLQPSPQLHSEASVLQEPQHNGFTVCEGKLTIQEETHTTDTGCQHNQAIQPSALLGWDFCYMEERLPILLYGGEA